MPRYYCDYCDTYLTHDSPSVRKQHNAGYKHKANIRSYYQQFEEQQNQSLIDQRIKEHLGQTAVFQQVGAAYNQHMLGRPRLPVLPTPILSTPGTTQLPLNSPSAPGIRPPVLPTPTVPGAPGYTSMPSMVPLPIGLQRLPILSGPATGPNAGVLAPNGGPPIVTVPTYQANSSGSSSGFDSYNGNGQPPDAKH
ncbi:hypothetical protein Ancab_019359 [Ancistrocladus abbreviatus]